MNTTTWKNRALSVLLTVIMVFSMLPLSVFAASGAVAEVTIGGNTTQYTDIDAAFAAAQAAESATVKLLADVTIPGGGYNYGIELNNGTITLDLNGKVIARKAGIQAISSDHSCFSVFYLNGEGLTLTIQDTSSEQSGRIVQPDGFPAVLVKNGASLTVTSGMIQNTSSEDYRGTYSSAYQLNCAVMNCWASYTTINGGTLTGKRGVVVNTNSYNKGGRLTITGGTISGTDGNALLAYVASRVTLSGGSFSTESNTHSIWVNESGNVETMLAEECSYVQEDGTASNYSEDSKGVVGNTIVKAPVRQEIQYVDATGTVVTRNEFAEITADTTDLTDGWYAVKENVSGYRGFVSGTVNLILCDGAEWNLLSGLRMGNDATLRIYAQTAGTGKLTVTGQGKTPAIGMDTGKSGGTLNIYGGVITAESKIPEPDPSGEASPSENRGAAIGTCGSSNSSMTVNIYGGTVTAKATYGAAAIGKGQAATGTVNVTIADGMKCVKTDELTVKAAYGNTEGDSVTISKCEPHSWEYNANADTHTATCALCDTVGTTEAHSFRDWTDNDDGTHTGTCEDCKAVKTEAHTPTFTPNADALTHSGKCSKCGYEVGTENHDFNQTDEYGKKCACDAYLTATYNNRNYATLASAIEADKNGGTVTLEKDTAESIVIIDGMNVTIDLNGKNWETTRDNGNKPALTVDGGSVTVKNGTMHTGAMASACTPVVINGGSLTVGESVTVLGTEWDDNRYCHAIEVNGGELTMSVGTKLVCGMSVPEGKQLKDYLPADTAFQQTDYNKGVAIPETAKIISGYVNEWIGNFDLTVVAHPAHDYTDGKCDCGYVCDHTGGNSREASYFQKAVCTICGAEYGDLLEDTIAPTGSITVKERTPFQIFINTITFGLFFKEDVTATVTATDDSSDQPGYDKSKHAVKIEYLVSNQAFTEEDLKAQTFTDYTKAIDLTDEQNYVVYARLTDHAGNETYLSTDGFVIDKTAPSINDFADGQEVHICGTSYTVSIKDANLDTVTLDGKKQSGDTIQFRYNYNGVEEHTVVATDKAGNTSTVTFFQHQAHDFDSETCVCKNCGAAAAAMVQIGDEEANLYGTFDEAWDSFLRITEPVKLTLLADADIDGIVSLGDFDLTVDLNGHTFGHTGQQFVLEEVNNVGTSKLTVTGAGSFLSSILVGTNGRLTVEADAGYIGGVKILFNQYGKEDSPTNWSVALKGGKYGELDMRYADKDGVTVVAAACGELAAPGYVFDRDDEVSSEAHATNVTVIPCPNHEWIDGVCDNCNLPCTHNWVDSKCTVCGYDCAHSSVEERDGNTYCSEMCGQQMAVKVEKDDSTTYYAKHFENNAYHAEDTLKGVFNKAENGSTITLLTDDLAAFGWIAGKNITLNLNGKNLIENNGIVVDIDSDTKTGGKLFVYGDGSSRAPEESMYTCTFRILDDSELVLNENFSGNYGTIYLENGVLTSDSTNMKIGALVIQNINAKITLKSGQFEMISIDREFSMTAGSLLERGYAFKNADGSYVAYDTEISEVKALENVTVVECDHQMTELPKGSQYYNHLYCPNCDEALGAVLTTADGKINGYKNLTDGFGRTGALSVAETTPGCTVTMYYDADGLGIWSTKEGFTLDANGCEIGTLTLSGGTLTVKNATITGDEHTDYPTVMTLYRSDNIAALTLENCLVEEQKESGMATLTANGPVTLKNTSVIGTTSVLSNQEQGLTVEESELNGEVTVRGSLTFKSGNASTSKITVYGAAEISGGMIDELDCSDAGSLIVSGGQFGKITSPDGEHLIDCLKGGYAFYYNSVKLADGRSSTLEGVYVAEHTHGDYKWDTATHEKVCACGDVKETDADDPTFDGIENGKTYYQNTLTFTAEDAVSGIKEVKDGDTVLIVENGKYTISAGNKEHTITATDNAGNIATVKITVYKVYNVTLPTGMGYTVEGDPTVGHGQDYTFTVTIANGYTATDAYAVKVNGEALAGTLSDSIYSYTVEGSKVDDDLTITVEDVADITAPEVEMTIGTNRFKELLSSLTFGLFFKETQTVKVTATDAGSGVAKAEYLVTDGVFGKDTMPADGWTAFGMNKNGEGKFSVEPNSVGSVYVRITDKAGNITVINSDGMVVYTDSEKVTDSIEFTRLSTGNVTITAEPNGNTVKSIRCDGEEIDSTLYTVRYPKPTSPSTAVSIELENAFLSTLAAGKHTITVAYDPMGIAYTPADGSGSQAPATTEVTLTVVKAERTLTFDAPNAIYDGEAYDDLRITDKPGRTTVHYKEQDANDSTYDTTAPKNAGSYTVKITVDADEDYNAKTFTKDFTISPKEVTIKDVVVKAVKEYDGSAAAEDMNIDAAYIDGKCTGDDLTIDITDAEANFSDKNVGTAKTVTFSGFKLGGSAAENYMLAAQPASVTADITAKALTIANLKVKDKVYDGTNAAEIDGTPTLNGVVDGDTLTLVNGTPAFSDTAVGKNIAITFATPFTLAGDEVTLKNYTLTQPTGITGNIVAWIADGSEYSVNSNDWINTDFTVTAKTGYQLSLTNAANGTWTDTLTASGETADGKLTFYVKNTATGVISSAVSESYKIDKTAPTGTITFDERTSFQKFLNTITFNLFFKDDVTVKLGADDEASGVKSVEYYKSDEALTLEEVKAVTDWTEADHFGITAEDMAQFVIYARITDNAGNITYLSSDGAEFDTTAPEIVGVENGKTYYVTRRVAVDDKNLASVKVNRETKNVNFFFDLIGDTDTVYTIVATDKAGSVTEYTVTMKPISDITDAIKDITAENVKSSDADAIDAVTQQILDIAAESDEDVIGAEQWNKLLAAAENSKKLEARIAEVSAKIDRLTEAVNGYDIDKVTSADKADIENAISDIETLLGGDNLTDTEKNTLESLREDAKALLDRIADAKTAAEAVEITAVKDITKDNVTLDNKDDLQKAEKALKKALDDFDGNYTDDERKALNNKLDTVKATLDAIENAEKAAEEIEKLPSADEVKPSDKDEIERINKIIDALTENEKSMLGEKVIGKLKALNDKLTELTDNAKKPTSPTTGDTSNLALWIALLFIGGGAVTGVTVAGKKKKQQDR